MQSEQMGLDGVHSGCRIAWIVARPALGKNMHGYRGRDVGYLTEDSTRHWGWERSERYGGGGGAGRYWNVLLWGEMVRQDHRRLTVPRQGLSLILSSATARYQMEAS